MFERIDARIVKMAQSPTAQAPQVSEGLVMLLVAFMSIALYNGLELFFWIFDFFKHRRGCYFWSMVISALGIIIFALAQILFFFNLAPKPVYILGISIGYLTMSTALALVLYARLHLVTSDRIARFVLYLVIITTLLFPLPMQVLFLTGTFANSMRVLEISLIYERLVVTVACGREYLILGIYIFEAFRNLKPVIAVKGHQGRKVRDILIATTVVIVFLDVGLLLTEFQERRAIKMTYSAFSSSVKLKMEFAILNKLINLVQSPSNSEQLPSEQPSSDQQPFHSYSHSQSHTRSRAQSLAQSINPFRRNDGHKPRLENRFTSGDFGTNGATCTALTRRRTLDEYHASVNAQACDHHLTPPAELHTFITAPARTSSWDELVQHPSTSSASKGVVVTQESKEALRPGG